MAAGWEAAVSGTHATALETGFDPVKIRKRVIGAVLTFDLVALGQTSQSQTS